MNALYVTVSVPLLLILAGFNHAYGLTTLGKSRSTQQNPQTPGKLVIPFGTIAKHSKINKRAETWNSNAESFIFLSRYDADRVLYHAFYHQFCYFISPSAHWYLLLKFLITSELFNCSRFF